MEAKIEKNRQKSDSESYHFLNCFFKHHFERIFNEKSLENRSKNDAKIDPNIIIKRDSQNVEILLPVEARTSKTRFQQPSNPLKFDEKSMQKVGSFPDRSWDRFLMDFCWIFAPSWESKLSKNRYKMVLKK